MATVEEQIVWLEKVIDKLRDVELESAGVGQVTVDGYTVHYENPREKRMAYERRLKRLQGKRPQASQLDLGSTW